MFYKLLTISLLLLTIYKGFIMDIKLSSGVIIGWQKGRIYQKVNATPAVVAHYE